MKFLVFFLCAILATCHGSDQGLHYTIYPLRMKTGLGGGYLPNVSCSSWRLGVETHNVIEFNTVPEKCVGYIGNYILGDQYRSDSKTVCREAFLYFRNLTLPKDRKNIWIFDIDETALSNLPYYVDHGFGVEPYNATAFNEWVELGEAPALPETLKLYKKLIGNGIRIVFLTGRPVEQKEITAKNLKRAGYFSWTKLILKDSSFDGQTAVTYKSAVRKELEEAGFRIIGNIGDQWSDILGSNPGRRTFKLPDPLYYIS